MTRPSKTRLHGLTMLSYRVGASFVDVRLARVCISRLHAFLFRLTRGRFPGSRSHLILSTTGRKTGKTRRAPLIYVNDERRYVIVASRGGSDHPPVWWLNLQANPEASIEIRGRTIRVRAAEASAEDRERIWPELVAVFPTYDDYVKRTERHIPVMLLTPTDQ